MKNHIKFVTILLPLLVLNSCSPKSETKNVAYIKLEIVKTEKDFEKLVAEKEAKKSSNLANQNNNVEVVPNEKEENTELTKKNQVEEKQNKLDERKKAIEEKKKALEEKRKKTIEERAAAKKAAEEKLKTNTNKN